MDVLTAAIALPDTAPRFVFSMIEWWGPYHEGVFCPPTILLADGEARIANL